MAACSSIRELLFILSLTICSFAQDIQQRPRQPDTTVPEKVSLNEVSAVQVPSLPAEGMLTPVLCEPDGGILLRLAMPDTGVEDPVSVSRDGKTVVRFGKEKIHDISRPALLSMFLVGSDVYILTRGSDPLGYETKWRTPTGEVQSQQATKHSTFVAHFQRDGTYAGSVRLDLVFNPQHLGVFENGDFLIAGTDQSMSEPRVAIVDSNGQIRRFVELKGDVHAQEESDVPGKGRDPTALPRFKPSQGAPESFLDVVSTSQIVRDGPKLLLFRPMNSPVFSISPSGEVRVHKLKVRGDYRLFSIKPTRSSWIVELIHEVPNSPAEEFATYAFDPESGVPLREYFFSRDLGFGLACTDEDEFTFVMADTENKSLKLLKLAPATQSKPN
jgi:hypothetical protein